MFKFAKRNNQFLEVIRLIQQSKHAAVKSINMELINLYWEIGKYIYDKIQSSQWGQGIIKELAEYISKTEPNSSGYSDKNLWRMKQFYETYKDFPKLSPLVRELSWTHNLLIFLKK